MKDCLTPFGSFDSNYAPQYGGAVYLSVTDANFVECSFTNNGVRSGGNGNRGGGERKGGERAEYHARPAMENIYDFFIKKGEENEM